MFWDSDIWITIEAGWIDLRPVKVYADFAMNVLSQVRPNDDWEALVWPQHRTRVC